MLKTLFAHIKEYKTPSLLTPVFMVLEVMMEMIIPILMASIVDVGIANANMPHVYKMGAIMLVCAVVGLMAGVGGAVYGAKASTGFAKNLREAMFENIQKFSFANIDKYSTSGLITRMTTDVTNIQNAYQMILRMCMRAPASLICAMAMSFFISPRIASVYLVAILGLSVVLVIIIKNAMHYFQEAFRKYDDLNESVQENVTAIRVVKAFVREDYEKERFKKASGNIRNMLLAAEKVVMWNAPVMMFTIYSCILLISWIGAKMIVADTLTTGDLMALLTYCMNILMNLMMLSMIFVMISMSSASAKRIAEVLEEESTLTNPENPVFEVANGDICFDNVTFRYNAQSEAPILDRINLEIKSGETIGIIGGTGSSKSSFVNLISRLYDVNDGEVRVGGLNVKDYDMTALRDQVAVVLQSNVLFTGTILENLRWGNKDATDEECMEACRLACADEFIQGFPEKYNTMINQGGTNVSGGQKQRLCIARALLKKPKILILDDSTSAVDTATDAKIRQSFKTAIPGTTKLIIAQRISSVMDAERIIVLDDGKLSGFGTHEELLASNEIYRDVYESQTKGGGDFDEGGAN